MKTKLVLSLATLAVVSLSLPSFADSGAICGDQGAPPHDFPSCQWSIPIAGESRPVLLGASGTSTMSAVRTAIQTGKQLQIEPSAPTEQQGHAAVAALQKALPEARSIFEHGTILPGGEIPGGEEPVQVMTGSFQSEVLGLTITIVFRQDGGEPIIIIEGPGFVWIYMNGGWSYGTYG